MTNGTGKHLSWRIGTVVAGVVTGTAVVAVHDIVLAPTDSILAQLVTGMVLAMMTQWAAATVSGALLGNLEVTIPGFVVAMVAMFIPWLPGTSMTEQLLAGGLIGASVFALCEFEDQRLHGKNMCISRPRKATTRHVLPGAWRAGLYDVFQGAGSRRRAWIQKKLFQDIEGKALIVGVGTGLNLYNLPRDGRAQFIAIDLDPDYIAAAHTRAQQLGLSVSFRVGDAESLEFEDRTFDTILAVATLCSVESPKTALAEFRRILRPGGRLLLFEHVQSSNPWLGSLMRLMDAWRFSRSPALAQETVRYVHEAGFLVEQVVCGYLDVYLAVWCRNGQVRPSTSDPTAELCETAH